MQVHHSISVTYASICATYAWTYDFENIPEEIKVLARPRTLRTEGVKTVCLKDKIQSMDAREAKEKVGEFIKSFFETVWGEVVLHCFPLHFVPEIFPEVQLYTNL